MKPSAHYRNFSRIDALIAAAAKQYRLEDAMQKYRALRLWQQAAGSFLAEAKELTRAVDFNNGVLRVACLSRELARRLRLLTPRIIEAINQLLGRPLVYAIYLEI